MHSILIVHLLNRKLPPLLSYHNVRKRQSRIITTRPSAIFLPSDQPRRRPYSFIIFLIVMFPINILKRTRLVFVMRGLWTFDMGFTLSSCLGLTSRDYQSFAVRWLATHAY